MSRLRSGDAAGAASWTSGAARWVDDVMAERRNKRVSVTRDSRTA
jgi:hypothetical protein